MRNYIQISARIIAPMALVLIIWLAAIRFSHINSALLPPPMAVAHAFWAFLTSGDLLGDTFWSLKRAGFGFICGGFLGVVLGTLTGRLLIFNGLLSPIFNGLRAIPPVAIIPLVIVWAGLGEPGKIFVTSWAAFFPVWLNTHDGVSSIDKSIVWASRSLGAKGRRLLFEVTLPSALPRILVGFRYAISATLVCVVVAEMTGASIGLGYRLQVSYLVFRVDRMMAYLIVLAIIGICADRIFIIITSLFFPWIRLRHDLR
jgi:ABC-type nitrate/sulfonate/bicarbonate transport system permease component